MFFRKGLCSNGRGVAGSQREQECRLLIPRFKRQVSGDELFHCNENSWAMVGEGFMIQPEGRNFRRALYKTGRGGKQIQLYVFRKANQFILNHSSFDF